MQDMRLKRSSQDRLSKWGRNLDIIENFNIFYDNSKVSINIGVNTNEIYKQ